MCWEDYLLAMRILLLAIISLALASCANTSTAERKAVPPKDSEDSNIPWNDPGQGGQSGGPLGGMLERR